MNRKIAAPALRRGDRTEAAALAAAERAFELRSPTALVEAQKLECASSREVRAQAFALHSMLEAGKGADDGRRRAEALCAQAVECGARSRPAQARIAYACGYLAYRSADAPQALAELNRAVRLFGARSRWGALVFDTLGMHFSHQGDLDRAHAYYLLSAEIKRSAVQRDPSLSPLLAPTYGNLGRLELQRERFDEAERWFRADLKLIQESAAAPETEAFLRNQLGLALLGRGKTGAARAELDRTLKGLVPESPTHVFVLKDLARVALDEGKPAEAELHVRHARELAARRGYSDADLSLLFVEGRIAAAGAARHGDAASIRALNAFGEAGAGYEAVGMWREVCEVALARAELLARLGCTEEALELLRGSAVPVAERYLFRQIQPLARIEAAIEALDAQALLPLRVRRLLGGLPLEELTGRLRGVRRRVTIWTCDIRGFTRFCDEAREPMVVVEALNRLFAAIGEGILDHGGRIDKYVGDNILAYFRNSAAAAEVALAALEAVDQVNTEREHLAEPPLKIGIGLATGEVVEGSVGFAGKLEHTLIGTPVNLACRLVGQADPGEILVDAATMAALRTAFDIQPARKRPMELKGLGAVQVYALRRRGKSRA